MGMVSCPTISVIPTHKLNSFVKLAAAFCLRCTCASFKDSLDWFAAGLRPSEHTYGSVLHAAARSNRLDVAKRAFAAIQVRKP